MFNHKFNVRASNAYELLSRIIDLILAEPLRINMNNFFTPSRMRKAEPQCGMVGCIGGWTNILSNEDGDRWAWDDERPAAETLGLSPEQAKELFWDRELINEAGGGGMAQTDIHARHVAEHIRAFQKKYREQLMSKAV